ncbi:hypothetical protein [Sphingomonas adhaesiva]|uniref:hypothetical protein n=1 Tax=Sphingomonas adhaesiva TaxID=28212 RepID=UPI002FF767A6
MNAGDGMVLLIVSLMLVAISVVLAVRANARFRGEDRIPMQWGITGKVTWSAPRRVAFAVMPLLVAGMSGFQLIMAITVDPRPGQEGLVLPVLAGIGVTLLAIQLLHARLIAWTLQRHAR